MVQAALLFPCIVMMIGCVFARAVETFKFTLDQGQGKFDLVARQPLGVFCRFCCKDMTRSSGRTSDITDFKAFSTNVKKHNEPIMNIAMVMRGGVKPMVVVVATVGYRKKEDELSVWRSMVGLPGSSSA